MTDIVPVPNWGGVRQLETNEYARGGLNGNMNEQAKSLASQNMYSRLYAGLPFDPVFAAQVGGFPIGGKVALENGDIVRSTVANNTNDPNVSMTGWVKTNDASQIFDNGKNQSQINSEKIDSAVIKVSEASGADNYEKMRNAINIANSKLLKVDIDVNVIVPSSFSLTDMIDIFIDVYSSNKSTVTYSKYGIPIFLIKKQGVNFGDGLTLIWAGVTPVDARAPQDFGTLKAAMGFNVSYDYNRNTATAPIIFLGVSGSCLCDFTITDEANLIYVCIASLPATTTSHNALHLNCTFDGIIFGLNSQNFDGLTGNLRGRRYGNLATSGIAPGHLIYLTQVPNLPVWSRNINIHVDDTQAKCVTAGLIQDDCSIKLLCVESVSCFIVSHRPHGAFDFTGKDVDYTVISNRNINRVANEGSFFTFRNQQPTLTHQTTGSFESYGINGTCIFDTLLIANERPVLVTNSYLQNSNMSFIGKVKAGHAINTLSGNNSRLKFSLNYEDPQNLVDSEAAMAITGSANCVNLIVEVDTGKILPKPIRFSQGNTLIGDVTLIDVTNSINSDNLIKRYSNSQKYTHKQRISGASTTPINIDYTFGYGDYEVLLVSSSDAKNSIYKSSAIISVGSPGGGLYIIDELGSASQKWNMSYTAGVLKATPVTSESSNLNVSIIKI